MRSLDDMPLNEAIELYYEKHHAIHCGDMEKLLAIKNKCPEIFVKEIDAEIRDIIEYALAFQKTDHYHKARRELLKKELTIIDSTTIED